MRRSAARSPVAASKQGKPSRSRKTQTCRYLKSQKVFLAGRHCLHMFNFNRTVLFIFFALALFWLPVFGEQSPDSTWVLEYVQSTQSALNSPAIYTRVRGYQDGQILAEEVGTGLAFWSGVGWGVAGGLIGPLLLQARSEIAEQIGWGVAGGVFGTGIGWALAWSDQVPPHLSKQAAQRGAEYYQGFRTGYKKNSKRVKQRSALKGGLIGTVIGAFLFVQYFD